MILRILIGLAVFALPSLADAQSALEQRGSYLVNGIMACGNCHTPKGPQGDIAEKAFSGGLTFDEPPFLVTASNITPDKTTGIGAWSDAELKTMLRTGVRPNGTAVAAVMPTGYYGIITDTDMDAIVAYLKSLKPVSSRVPAPVYRMQIPVQTFPGSEKPYTAADLQTPVSNGFYLATIGHCMECHTPFGPAGRDFANALGKGGFEMKGPWGVSVSRNITASATSGLGAWSDAEIKRAITKGISRNGSPLAPPMGFHYYDSMTESDLSAVVAYLRTVPARD